MRHDGRCAGGPKSIKVELIVRLSAACSAERLVLLVECEKPMANMLGAKMTRMDANRPLLHLVLTDLHFWVPVLVLLGGLVVLRWIS